MFFQLNIEKGSNKKYRRNVVRYTCDLCDETEEHTFSDVRQGVDFVACKKKQLLEEKQGGNYIVRQERQLCTRYKSANTTILLSSIPVY